MHPFKFILPVLLLLCQAMPGMAQSASIPSELSPRWAFFLGAHLQLSENTGETASYLRQRASDASTLFGITSTYASQRALGWGLDYRSEFRPLPALNLGLGFGIEQITSRQSFQNAFDPPNASVSSQTRTITDRAYYASPKAYLGGNWKWATFNAGIEINAFLTARTQREISTEFTNGSTETETATARGVIYDQPIYADPSSPTGINDYTDRTGYNYGFNPLQANAFFELRLQPLGEGKNPAISIGYILPATSFKRSNNPAWSLVTQYDPGTLAEINLSSRLSTARIGLAWGF